MQRLIFIVPIIAFAGLAGFLGFGLTQDPKELPSQLIDRPLPEFALPGIDGPALASASFRGEPRLLNIWASWCAACPQEHPVLERIAAEGFPVYGIAWKDKPDDSRAFLARFGNPYAGLGADQSGRTAIDLGVTGAPETFVIDAQGRVRFKQIGPISPEVWEGRIRPLLQQLRAEA
jgi:cytochrome c biogenesis protein CcmG/thiol:disulfide interchange protein DsbE